MSDDVVLKIDVDDSEFTSFMEKFNSFSTKGVAKGAEKTKKELSSFDKFGKTMKSSGDATFKAFSIATLSISGATIALLSFTKAMAESVKGAFVLGRNTGTATKNVQALEMAFKHAGMSPDQAGGALESVSKMKTFVGQSSLLNIHKVDKNQDTSKILLSLLSKIKSSGMPIEIKSQQLQQLGFSEVQSVAFSEGKMDIEGLFKEFSKEYRTSENDTKKTQEFLKEFDKLGIQFKQLGVDIAVGLIPHLKKLIQFVKGLVSKGLADKIVSGLKTFADIIYSIVMFFRKHLGKFGVFGEDVKKEVEQEQIEENKRKVQKFRVGMDDPQKQREAKEYIESMKKEYNNGVQGNVTNIFNIQGNMDTQAAKDVSQVLVTSQKGK